MVSEQTRILIWRSLLSAEARSTFFGQIAAGRQGLERLMALSVGVLSSGAFLALVAKWNKIPNLTEMLSAGSAVFGIMLLVFSFGKSATLAASIHRKWGVIASEFEGLFHELPQLDETTALERWKTIDGKHFEIDEVASLEFKRRRRLFLKSQELVEKGRGLGKLSTSAASTKRA